MIDTLTVAERRASKLPPREQLQFLIAFEAGLRLERDLGDVDGSWSRLTRTAPEWPVWVAGWIEGVSAARTERLPASARRAVRAVSAR